MRNSQVVRAAIAALLLSLLAVSVMLAEESSDHNDWFAVRLSGGATGSPQTMASAKLEAAVGQSGFSLAAWMELPYLPFLSAVAGGDLTVSLDWLSLSASLRRELALRQSSVSFVGRATPPAWLLYAGSPGLLGGVTATATVTDGPQWSSDGNGLTLSPYLTGVVFVGEALLSSTVGFDARIESDARPPRVSSSRVVSTVDVRGLVLTNALEFSGTFDRLAAVSVSFRLPQVGLTLTGSFLPSTTSSESNYRVSASYVFGNQDLLPFVSEDTGLVCSGDTCFVP